MTLHRFSLGAVVVAACAGFAVAQETGEVFLAATYLGAPTEWCPADEGVPVVIEMDGPDIIAGPNDWPRSVKVRRGGEVGRVIISEENTVSMERDSLWENAEVVGRFHADFRACQKPWFSYRVTGNWRLTSTDGSQADGGEIDNSPMVSSVPFFRRLGRDTGAIYARFGDRILFARDGSEITRTQTFAAETDKE